MKRSYKWLPALLFLVGLAVYIYYGITWNAWEKNLPNIIINAVICLALWWALKKKDSFKKDKE